MNKKIAIEWGILTIISFLLYDMIWPSTPEELVFYQAKGVFYYLLADFIYCACLSFCIVWTDSRIARLNYFSRIGYKRQLLLSATLLLNNVLIAVILENTYDLLVSTPYDSFWEDILIVCLISTLSTLARSAQYYSRMISMQSEQIIAAQKGSALFASSPSSTFIITCQHGATSVRGLIFRVHPSFFPLQ